MNPPETTITDLMNAYAAAVYAKDVDAFTALYAQDVCVFDMWGTWSYDGIQAWRAMVVDWFGSLGTERVSVGMTDVHTTVTGDLAFTHGLVTFQGLSVRGEVLRSMQNRLTWMLTRDDGTWKIIHEHTSAPIDFKTAKVMLTR